MTEDKAPTREFFPEPYPMTPEQRAAALAKIKAEFSAADLQRFTEEDDGIPMEQILKECEELHRNLTTGSQ
jgi:hypothetical protein